MCRFLEETNADGEVEVKVHGVLTDYDLSSWTRDLKSDYTKTSQQRTGTPPYMAQELLKGTSPLHLYRHDIESLFNIMLLMGARHTIGTPKGEKKPRVIMRKSGVLPYEDWFNESRHFTLGSLKGTFLVDMQAIELSPVFEDFRPWLKGLQHCFSTGFKKRPSPSDDELPEWAVALTKAGVQPATVQFDDETLGGYIKYATVIAPVQHLRGQLKGLVIRDPKYPLALKPSTSAVST